MLWINEHKRVWRIAIIVVGVIALLGPWAYDRINVPAEFTCSAPNVRLYGDFCGVPITGIMIYGDFLAGLLYGLRSPVESGVTSIEWVRHVLYSLVLFLLILPLFSTLFIILRGEGRRRQVFSIVAWGLAGGIALLLRLSMFPQPFFGLWGLWLYIILAACALILEVLALVASREPVQARMAT